jgi:hypothetical protein
MTILFFHPLRVTVILFLTSLTLAAGAGATTLTPVADTFITVHPTLGGASSNHGSDSSLFVIGPNAPQPVVSHTLVRFDLSAYAGQTVQGPVAFSMYVQGTDFNNSGVPDRNIIVRNIAGTWGENTVNANNATLVPGVTVATQSVHYLTSADNGYVSWTLPAAYVQTWIDAPLSNDGLFVQNLTGGPLNDLQFGSRESGNPPLLTFTVPEPSALAALCVGAVGVIGRKRGRRSR